MSIGRDGQIPPHRTQTGELGGFLSNSYASELTVPHKTVAEPL